MLDIQEETLDDIANLDGEALLHLAWAICRRSKKRILLCATLELLAKDREVSPQPEAERTILGKTYFLWCRTFILSAQDALGWYRQCAAGDVRIPPEEPPGERLELQPLLAEPPWPGLSFPTQKVPGTEALPPGRSSVLLPSSRTWVDEQFGVDAKALRDWLGSQFHFDFDIDPEHVGAAHFFVPDPELKHVACFRKNDTNSLRFGIELVPEFYADAPEGYTLLFYRRRPQSKEAPIALQLDGPKALTFPHSPENFSYDVIHSRRGLVWSVPSAVFITGVSGDVSIVTRRREVTVPATPGRPEERYGVSLTNSIDQVSVQTGGLQPQRAAGLLWSNSARSEKRRHPYQLWFSGDADKAVGPLRKIVAHARKEVWLVDPYFDHIEFARFALAVGNTGVPIKILTSSMGLRLNANRHPGRKLRVAIDLSAANSTGHPNVEARVMLGKRPEVHDRFLMVDDAAWLLGSSFNEFGKRGAMLVALPSPATIRTEIALVWTRSKPLAEWIAARQGK